MSFSAPTIDNEAALTTSSLKVVEANSKRQLLVITNTSSVNVYLAFGTDAVSGKGLLLFPNQSIEINVSKELLSSEGWKTMEVDAIAASGTGNTLVIFEASFEE